MKCPICGKEAEPHTFCTRCGAYLEGDVSREDAPRSMLDVSAIKVKRSATVEVFVANFKFGFVFNIILVVFFTAFFALALYHLLIKGISVNELVLLSLPFTFMVATAVGLVRYIPLIRYLPAVTSAESVVIRRKDSFDLDYFYRGRVYRCTLANRYTLSRKGKGVRVYLDDAPCALDLARLEAFFAEEGDRL